MPPMTIALEPDAYEHLESARRSDEESFSDVVRRAVWPDAAFKGKGADIVAYLRSRSDFLDEAALDAIEKADRNDPHPVSPWLEP